MPTLLPTKPEMGEIVIAPAAKAGVASNTVTTNDRITANDKFK
jgi:hypothetical protein